MIKKSIKCIIIIKIILQKWRFFYGCYWWTEGLNEYVPFTPALHCPIAFLELYCSCLSKDSGDTGDDCLEMEWAFSSLLLVQAFLIPGVHIDVLLVITSLLFHCPHIPQLPFLLYSLIILTNLLILLLSS